ncbi:MAG: hypothetical protein J7K47_06090 [Thermoplasmata archaeon]|nr:hypothetical protein [Thermoplasmata archaeon]
MKGKMVLVTVGMFLMMPFFAISITPNHIVINENEKPSHIWRGSLNRMEPKSSPEELI